MTWQGEVVAALSTAFVLCGAMWRWGERIVATLERHTRTKQRQDERLGELEKSERDSQAKVNGLAAEVYELRIELGRKADLEEDLRQRLRQSSEHNAVLAADNAELRKNPSEKSIETMHRLKNPPRGREHSRPFRTEKKGKDE